MGKERDIKKEVKFVEALIEKKQKEGKDKKKELIKPYNSKEKKNKRSR